MTTALPDRRRARRAFTLIEGVVSLTLTAILLSAGVGVMLLSARSLPTRQDAAEQRLDSAAALQRLVEDVQYATVINDRMENIGARRLHTVMTTLLDDLLYELPDVAEKNVVFDGATVKERLMRIVEDEDLRKYIL